MPELPDLLQHELVIGDDAVDVQYRDRIPPTATRTAGGTKRQHEARERHERHDRYDEEDSERPSGHVQSDAFRGLSSHAKPTKTLTADTL